MVNLGLHCDARIRPGKVKGAMPCKPVFPIANMLHPGWSCQFGKFGDTNWYSWRCCPGQLTAGTGTHCIRAAADRCTACIGEPMVDSVARWRGLQGSQRQMANGKWQRHRQRSIWLRHVTNTRRAPSYRDQRHPIAASKEYRLLLQGARCKAPETKGQGTKVETGWGLKVFRRRCTPYSMVRWMLSRARESVGGARQRAENV